MQQNDPLVGPAQGQGPSRRPPIARLGRLIARLFTRPGEGAGSTSQQPGLQQQLSLALAGGAAGFWSYAPASQRITLSVEARQLMGLAAEPAQWSVEAWLDSVRPDHRELVRAVLMAAGLFGQAFELEWPIASAAGPDRWLLARAQPRDAAPGVFDGTSYHGIVLDITQQRLEQARTQHSEEILNLLLQSSSDCILDFDVPRDRITLAGHYEKLIDPLLSAGELDFEGFCSRVHADDAAHVREVLHGQMRGEQAPRALAFRLVSLSGRARWAELRGAVAVRGARGDVVRVVALLADIHDLHVARSELRRYLTAFQHAPVASLVVEQDFSIHGANLAFQSLFGYPSPGLQGRRVDLLIPPEELVSFNPRERLAAVRRTGHWSAECERLAADGSRIPVRVRIVPLGGADEPLLGAMVSYEDLRAERLHLATRQRLDEVERKAAARSAFLANTSHEIRTPLTAVLGLAHLLSRKAGNEGQRQLADQLETAGRSLLTVVDDILELARIEAGQLTLEPRAFDFLDLVDYLAAILNGQAPDKRIERRLRLPRRLPGRLVGDEMRLRQVLANLISNAIKFTAQGQVEVALELESQADAQATLRFSVADSGIGMETAELQRIFEAFRQGDATIARRFGGWGLGLSLAHRLVALMGGTLAVESTPAVGSLFSFALRMPFEAAPAGEIAPQPGGPLLIGARQPADALALGSVAALLGWSAERLPCDAPLAEWQARLQAQGDEGTLLLAIEGEGYDRVHCADLVAAARLRAPRRRIVAAVPVHAYSRLSSELFGIGVDSVLTQPVTPRALLGAVAGSARPGESLPLRLPTHTAAALPASPPGLPPPPGRPLSGVDAPDRTPGAGEPVSTRLAGLHLLVIDDSDINLEVMRRILEAEGATVSSALSGPEGLALLDRAPAPPSMILLDLQMPGMSGQQVLKVLRSRRDTESRPVIAITAGLFREDEQALRELGFDEVLGKPISVAAILDCLEQLRDRNAVPAGHAPSPAGPCKGVVDWRQGEVQWRGTAAHLHYLRKFFREYRGAPALIRQVDSEDAARIAHLLSGAAGAVALPALARESAALEAQIRAGSLSRDAVDALARRMEEAEQAVAEVLASDAVAPGPLDPKELEK